jgi:hypothetical protein
VSHSSFGCDLFFHPLSRTRFFFTKANPTFCCVHIFKFQFRPIHPPPPPLGDYQHVFGTLKLGPPDKPLDSTHRDVVNWTLVAMHTGHVRCATKQIVHPTVGSKDLIIDLRGVSSVRYLIVDIFSEWILDVECHDSNQLIQYARAEKQSIKARATPLADPSSPSASN